MHEQNPKTLSDKTEPNIVAEKGLVCFSTYYPGFINLPYNQWFIFEFEGELVAFHVIEHLEPLHYIGFNKALHDELLIKFSKANKEQIELTFTARTTDNRSSNPYKSIINSANEEVAYTKHYTKLFFCNEGERVSNQLKHDHNFKGKIDEIIRNYRLASGDYKIPLFNDIRSEFPLAIIGFKEFSADQLTLSSLERLTGDLPITFQVLNYSVKPFDRFESTPLSSNPNPEEILAKFNLVLNAKKTTRNDTYYDGLGMAKRAFANENYKFAFLEVFMLLEVVVSDFVTNKKIRAGVSKTKLDAFSKDLRFSYMLNVEVPIFINDLTDKKRTIIGKVDCVRKKRNDIIHEGENVSEAEARNAIETIQEFVILLDENEDIEM